MPRDIGVRHADVLVQSAPADDRHGRASAQDCNLMRELRPPHPYRHYSALAAPATRAPGP